MPRKEISPWYQQLIATCTEEGLKAPAIARQLKEEAQRKGRADFPSERTVRRYAEKHLKRPIKERKEYAEVRWPDNLGDLSWEAGPVILELLRAMNEAGRGRPTLRVARWYWRVHQAAVGLPDYAEHGLAGLYGCLDEFDRVLPGEETRKVREGLEWWLAYRPWAKDAGRVWAERVRSGTLPDPVDALLALVERCITKGVPMEVVEFLLEELEPVTRAMMERFEGATGMTVANALDRAAEQHPVWQRATEHTRGGLMVMDRLKALGPERVLQMVRAMRQTYQSAQGQK